MAAELLRLEQDAVADHSRHQARLGGQQLAKLRWRKVRKKDRREAAQLAGLGNRRRSKKDLRQHAQHAAEARWELWRQNNPEKALAKAEKLLRSEAAARMNTRSTKTQARKKPATKKQGKP